MATRPTLRNFILFVCRWVFGDEIMGGSAWLEV